MKSYYSRELGLSPAAHESLQFERLHLSSFLGETVGHPLTHTRAQPGSKVQVKAIYTHTKATGLEGALSLLSAVAIVCGCTPARGDEVMSCLCESLTKQR